MSIMQAAAGIVAHLQQRRASAAPGSGCPWPGFAPAAAGGSLYGEWQSPAQLLPGHRLQDTSTQPPLYSRHPAQSLQQDAFGQPRKPLVPPPGFGGGAAQQGNAAFGSVFRGQSSVPK
jgi:hypothetical protein